MRQFMLLSFLTAGVAAAQVPSTRRFAPHVYAGTYLFNSDVNALPGWQVTTGGDLRINSRFFAGFNLTTAGVRGSSADYVQHLKPGIVAYDAGDIYLNDGEVVKSDLRLSSMINQGSVHLGMIFRPRGILTEKADIRVSAGMGLAAVNATLNYTDRRDSVNMLWLAKPNAAYGSQVTETLKGRFFTVPVDLTFNYRPRPGYVWFLGAGASFGRLGQLDVIDEPFAPANHKTHFFYHVSAGVRFELLKP